MAFLGVEKSEDIKQAKQVEKNDKLDLDFCFLVLDTGSEEPKPVKLGDLIKGKKAVLFGLPGMVRHKDTGRHFFEMPTLGENKPIKCQN
jgi:hypothetical protein